MNQLATTTAANSNLFWKIKTKGIKMHFVSMFLFAMIGLSGVANAQFTNLYSFSGTPDGAQPNADLVFDGTYFYGMTTGGGTNGLGTIFKIMPNGTGYVKLLDFAGATNGSSPFGSLVSDGTFLYGMTRDGGLNSVGTIFKIMPDGTGYVKLLDFGGAVNGYGPRGSLTVVGSVLYGMTPYGGSANAGTIFKIGTNGAGYAEISDFGTALNGGNPFGSLLYDGTYLYGMAYNGGTNSWGTIFKILPNGTSLQTLLDFDGTLTGRSPWGSLILNGSYLYGMAANGGTNDMGTVFKIMPDGTGYVKLHDFDGTINGGDPRGDLVSDGTFLYGMTSYGGLNNNNYGTMFRIMPDGTGYEKLLDFSGSTNGNAPFGSLISVDNSLYGMTFFGGANWEGNIFKYGPCSDSYSLLTHSSCASSYTLNSITYNASGNYTQTIPNVAGCDSVIELELNLYLPSASSLEISSCSNSYTLNSITYNASGSYTQTLTNFFGCDSIVTIDLTLNGPSVGQPGELDLCFDPGMGANNEVYTTTLQPDGKIIIGGAFTSYDGTARNRIARLNADGSHDNAFNPGTGLDESIYTASLQPNGKVIIGGDFTNYNGIGRNRIVRLNADGSIDNTFNPGTGATGFVGATFLQPDGKVIIGGSFTNYNGTGRNRIARVNADGSLDNTFDPGTGADFYVHAIALQPDGKIIVGGSFTTYNGIATNSIARLNANGSLDNTFNSTGTGLNSGISNLTLQPDGKVIIGGGFTSYDGIVRKYIARLNADGSLDNTFNSTGTGLNSTVSNLTLQPDGKVIIGGGFTSYNSIGTNHIARLNADGSLDNTFNSAGTGASTSVEAMSLQPDGKIIIVGAFTDYNGTSRNRVARVHGDLTVSIDNQDLTDANIHLFPNPTQGELTLQAENLNGAIVTVYNSTGQLVLTQKVGSENSHTLNLSDQTSGLYIIEVNQPSRSNRFKISKQ